VGAFAAAAAVLCGAGAARAGVDRTGFQMEVRISFSLQNPAFAIGLAGFYSWASTEIGAFVEVNPWQSVEQGRMSMGVTNVGVIGHYLFNARPDMDVRVGIAAGVSILNEEMIGSDAGTIGFFANVKLLGLTWAMNDKVAMSIDGFDLALPVPQRVGVPIVYSQQRLSMGLRLRN
jgi:hypothetical protein